MLIQLVCLTALANTSPVALFGPAKDLSFGMSVEQVAKVAPKALYPGVSVSLSPEAFALVQRSSPELFQGRSTQTGGNRFNKSTSVESVWPVIDSARWTAEINADGLSRVRIHYETEAAALQALTKRFGAPAIVARWKIWASPETRIRAVFTGCFQSTANGKPVGPNECSVELSSYRPLNDLVSNDIFPKGKTLVGKQRADFPLGYLCGETCTTVQLKAYESSSGSVPLELHWDENGKVTGYRTQLDYTYNAKNRSAIKAALQLALGPPDVEAECMSWGTDIEICERSTVFTVKVGAINR